VWFSKLQFTSQPLQQLTFDSYPITRLRIFLEHFPPRPFKASRLPPNIIHCVPAQRRQRYCHFSELVSAIPVSARRRKLTIKIDLSPHSELCLPQRDHGLMPQLRVPWWPRKAPKNHHFNSRRGRKTSYD
jgi:hypothetical protein